MNSLALAIAFPLVLVVLCGSKRMALLAIAAGVLYLPQYQAVEVLGITLTSTRVFELAGFLRVLLRGETGAVQFNKIDRTFLLLYAYTTLVFLLRSETQQKEMIGTTIDAVFSYFTFRALIGDVEDVRWFLRRFLLCLVPFAGLLAVESQTGQNPFAVLGGGFFDMRDGRLRALGSFRNASSLGTLGASLLPLYVALAWDRDGRISGGLGVGIACAIVYYSNSGGPASAAAVAARRARLAVAAQHATGASPVGTHARITGPRDAGADLGISRPNQFLLRRRRLAPITPAGDGGRRFANGGWRAWTSTRPKGGSPMYTTNDGFRRHHEQFPGVRTARRGGVHAAAAAAAGKRVLGARYRDARQYPALRAEATLGLGLHAGRAHRVVVRHLVFRPDHGVLVSATGNGWKLVPASPGALRGARL